MTTHDIACGACGAVTAFDSGCSECRVPDDDEPVGCDRCGDISFSDDQLVAQPNGQRICGACALNDERANA